MTYSQVGLPPCFRRAGGRSSICWRRGAGSTRRATYRAEARKAVAREGHRALIEPWAAVRASADLGETAEATWVRCLGCVPSASMRAASLSHSMARAVATITGVVKSTT